MTASTPSGGADVAPTGAAPTDATPTDAARAPLRRRRRIHQRDVADGTVAPLAGDGRGGETDVEHPVVSRTTSVTT
jgi:hypothetical protein